jgi:hypothetical protein
VPLRAVEIGVPSFTVELGQRIEFTLQNMSDVVQNFCLVFMGTALFTSGHTPVKTGGMYVDNAPPEDET